MSIVIDRNLRFPKPKNASSVCMFFISPMTLCRMARTLRHIGTRIPGTRKFYSEPILLVILFTKRLGPPKHSFERIALEGLTINFPYSTQPNSSSYEFRKFWYSIEFSLTAFEGRFPRSYDSGLCMIDHFPR
jgi:hypothetical protein